MYTRLNGTDIVWRGTYNASQTYYPGDWVIYNGMLYRATAQIAGAPQTTNTQDTVPTLGSTNAAQWYLNGNASNTATGECRLTPANTNQSGSTFYKTPISLLHNLTISFQSECSGGSGADGYCLNLVDSRYTIGNPGTLWASVGNGGFFTRMETYSGGPPVTQASYRDSGQATPTTTQLFSVSETSTSLRQINNWVFTLTRTATNTYTVNITKNGTTYGASPYTGVFIADTSIIGFSGVTGGATDNQYIRNFSALSGLYQAWQAVNHTVYSGAGAPAAGNYDPNSFYFNTTLRTLYIWSGATPTWVPLDVNRASTVTSNYTMTPLDRIILANGTGLTITLPDPTVAIDRTYTVKNINPSSVTVNSPSGNIDGTTNQTLAQYAVLRAVSDGSNWWAV